MLLEPSMRSRYFGSAGRKSELTERNLIFGNKTAGCGSLKLGFGRQNSGFHRIFGNAERKYAANFGTFERTALFMKRIRR